MIKPFMLLIYLQIFLTYTDGYGPKHPTPVADVRMVRPMRAKTLHCSSVALLDGSAHGPNLLWAETSNTRFYIPWHRHKIEETNSF